MEHSNSMDPDALRPHQIQALRKMSNGKILWGGVGSGKSHVAATYYKEQEAPRDVYVITTAKKRDSFDWQELFYRLGVGPRSGPSGPAGVLLKSDRRGAISGSDDSGRRDTSLDGTTGDSREFAAADPEDVRLGVSSRTRLPDGGELGAGRGSAGGREDVVGSLESVHAVAGEGLHEQPSGRIRGHVESAPEGGHYPYVLTVDSWNNIAKYADVAGAFFIFDEQRLVGSGDWTRKFLRIAKHNRWILLSGTPGDTWMDYVPVFVANNFYKNRTDFKRKHVVYNTFTKFPKVDRYIDVGRLARLRAELLVEMPYVRHTRRRHVQVPLHYDKDALELVLKKRWHVYEDRPLRDVAEMFSVGRKVVNSDPSRLEMVKELWQNHPKLIVFYNFNYELEALRSLRGDNGLTSMTSSDSSSPISQKLSSSKTEPSTSLWKPASTTTSSPGSPTISISNTAPGKTTSGSTSSVSTTGRGSPLASGTVTTSTKSSSTSIAEWNGHKHEPVPTSNTWLYLVQYIAGAEAWECTETDAMIFYSRNYSWKIWEQAQGRIDRLNTLFSELWYYNFTSDSWVDRAIERSLAAKETFNEAKFVRMFKG